MADTRAEHLAWCKERALAYVDQGDAVNAWSSFVSDLRKHPETHDHAALELGTMLAFTGHLSTVKDVRDFINGCN
ncbi:MAG TPA: hypothetical protein VIK31_03185 [Propionibacteriaceae bacterium]